MADEHLFKADAASTSIPAEGKSRWHSCLTGCLIGFAILLVLAVLVGFWIAHSWRNLVASVGTEGIRQAISTSQLPPQEQQEIMVQVDRVATAFRDRTMSSEQLRKLAQQLVESPLMSLIVTSTIDQHYFARSGLSEEEKAEGRKTLQRFVRGAIDGKIDRQGMDAAMAHVADRDGRNQWKLRENLTDQELQAFLAEAKKQADAADIPDQPADIDPSDEIKKIVDEALAAPA
jgi:hypothetical protein